MPDAPIAPVATPAPVLESVVSSDAGDKLLIPRDVAEPIVETEQPVSIPEARSPAAEARPVVEKPATPPPGYVPQEMFNRHKSILDQREAQTRKEINELRSYLETQAVEKDITGYRQAWTKRLSDASLDPAEFAQQIEAGVQNIRDGVANTARTKASDERAAVAEQMANTSRGQLGSVILTSWVEKLSDAHKLTDEADLTIIRGYARQMPALSFDDQGNVSPEYVEAGNGLAALAQRLGDGKKAIADAKKAQVARVPNGTVMESGQGGATMSDAQYVSASNSGRVTFDASKLRDAMRRMGTLDE